MFDLHYIPICTYIPEVSLTIRIKNWSPVWILHFKLSRFPFYAQNIHITDQRKKGVADNSSYARNFHNLLIMLIYANEPDSPHPSSNYGPLETRWYVFILPQTDEPFNPGPHLIALAPWFRDNRFCIMAIPLRKAKTSETKELYWRSPEPSYLLREGSLLA